MKHIADQFLLVFPDLVCACGERWGGGRSVPKHLRTAEHLRYVLNEWNKKHSEHISNAGAVEKLLKEAQ